MILCHTSTIFCGMPIIFSVIFRIHSVILSICCVMGIICSVIVVIHPLIFTISSAVLCISCLWFIIQPLPSIISKSSSHPYSFMCHSKDIVSHVYKTFCDHHKSFVTLIIMRMSFCCWVSEQWCMFEYMTIIVFAHSHLGLSGAIG